jgi:hypothetical protein
VLRTRDLLTHVPFLSRHLETPAGATACRVRRAITADDLARAYRLADNAALPGAEWHAVTGTAGLGHRALPETAVFIAEVEHDIVGVMALVPYTPGLGLPADETFGRELNLLREMGSRTAELTHAALAPDAPALLVLAELLRAAFAQAVQDGRDELFIGVADRYGRVFEEVFQFDRWNLQKPAGPSGGRFCGRRLSLACIRQRLRRADRRLGRDAFLDNFFFAANPYHDYVRPWSVMAAKTFRSAAALQALFTEPHARLHDLAKGQREVLRQRWGEAVFTAVVERVYPDLAMAEYRLPRRNAQPSPR